MSKRYHLKRRQRYYRRKQRERFRLVRFVATAVAVMAIYEEYVKPQLSESLRKML